MRSRLRSTAGMRSSRQCFELATEQFVDLFLMRDGDAKQVFGKAADFGLDFVDRLSRTWRAPGQASACRRRPERASASRVRGTCDARVRGSWVKPTALPLSFCELAVQAHHLNGCGSGFKSLVSGLDAGAIERLLQRLAGEHAKAVRNARLLLRLADAARHFVVDGFVVGRLAAQQAAQRS